MSMTAMAWALERARCARPQAKLVLITLANFANELGQAYPASATIVRITGLNIKTVRAAIDALEADLFITDTGVRKGQTQQVKVYQLAGERDPETDVFVFGRPEDAPLKLTKADQSTTAESHPKTDALKAPVSGSKDVQKRVAEPVTEPSPLDNPSGLSAPKGGKRGKSISISDWVIPTIVDLPDDVRTIAEQWPIGAYSTYAETHRRHQMGRGGRTRGADHDAGWYARIVQLGGTPIREARAGLSFGQAAPADGLSAGLNTTTAQASALESAARLMDRMGRRDDAAEHRRTAAAMLRKVAA